MLCLERTGARPSAQSRALAPCSSPVLCTEWREAAGLTMFSLPARRQSGSFLSTGWFTMILALELCEDIVVYGMVSDSYCRSGQPGPGQKGSWGGLTLEGLGAVECRLCGLLVRG